MLRLRLKMRLMLRLRLRRACVRCGKSSAGESTVTASEVTVPALAVACATVGSNGCGKVSELYLRRRINTQFRPTHRPREATQRASRR